jgi:hypothetical protein
MKSVSTCVAYFVIFGIISASSDCEVLCILDGPDVCTAGSTLRDGICEHYFVKTPDTHCYSPVDDAACPGHPPMQDSEAFVLVDRAFGRTFRSHSLMGSYSPPMRPSYRRRRTQSHPPESSATTPASTPQSTSLVSRLLRWIAGESTEGQSNESHEVMEIYDVSDDIFIGDSPWRDGSTREQFSIRTRYAIERIKSLIDRYGAVGAPHSTSSSWPLFIAYVSALGEFRRTPYLPLQLWETLMGPSLLELGVFVPLSAPHRAEILVTLLTVASELSGGSARFHHVSESVCSAPSLRDTVIDDHRIRSRTPRAEGANPDGLAYQWGLEAAPLVFLNRVCPDLVLGDSTLKYIVWDYRVTRKRMKAAGSTPQRSAIRGSDRQVGQSVLLVPRRPTDELLRLSLEQIRGFDPTRLTVSLTVEYSGEIGIDRGGLLRDWFAEMTKALAEGTLVACGNNRRNCYSVPESGVDYESVGKFIALSLIYKVPIGIRFPRAMWGVMFDEPTTLRDLEYDDPVMFKRLSDLLTTDLDVVELFNHEGTRLSESNRDEFIQGELERRMVIWKNESTGQAFINGFKRLIPPSELRDILDGNDINELIEGEPVIDPVDMLQHVVPNGLFYSEETWGVRLEWFRNVVLGLDQKMLKALSQFCTGDAAVPVGGFRNMKGVISLDPDLVEEYNDQRLPTSRTCFNQIFIPLYSSEEIMRDRLVYAIESDSGFQIC